MHKNNESAENTETATESAENHRLLMPKIPNRHKKYETVQNLKYGCPRDSMSVCDHGPVLMKTIKYVGGHNWITRTIHRFELYYLKLIASDTLFYKEFKCLISSSNKLVIKILYYSISTLNDFHCLIDLISNHLN